jgi:subtilisin family serine protease/N-acetyl-anhydromuramyl-L-alanine amidase AmpD
MSKNYGNYIVLNDLRLALEKHPTDFSIIGSADMLAEEDIDMQPLSLDISRVSGAQSEELEPLMSQLRENRIAHHIYLVAGTGEEIVIEEHIFVEFHHQAAELLEEIMQKFNLILTGRMAEAYILKVTDATGRNPLKVANEIAQRDEVMCACPQVLLELEFYHQPALLASQWYLTSELAAHSNLRVNAGIQAPEAWEITTGNPEIVVAVIDDGFNLAHPALQNVKIHPARRDFLGQDFDPNSEGGNYHGTPVSSIIFGSHENSTMLGIAPDCTFLPIRIGFGPMIRPTDILDVFRYASKHADVVNCSFGTLPRSYDPMSHAFRHAIRELTKSGGRRGKGLVMLFSAGNDDAPTFLAGQKNINGVKYTRRAKISSSEGGGIGQIIQQIPPEMAVYSGYPLIQGVIVVGAMTSLKRKAAYSSWGAHITVVAPSNNFHYITTLVEEGSDSRREAFVANYRGLGLVAASNQQGHGSPFSPIKPVDDPMTANLRDDLYTKQFGGTSGAAPIVTAVVALMLSVNPELTAEQVRLILMATAEQDLDPTLDLANDPNIQGLSGEFVGGRSPFFGYGKVNAYQAVRRARALQSLFERLNPQATTPVNNESADNDASPPMTVSSAPEAASSVPPNSGGEVGEELRIPVFDEYGPENEANDALPAEAPPEPTGQPLAIPLPLPRLIFLNLLMRVRTLFGLSQIQAATPEMPQVERASLPPESSIIVPQADVGARSEEQTLTAQAVSDIRERINWRGSLFKSSRGRYKPEAIVIHIAEGSFRAIGLWFNDRRANVSAHYGISKQGKIDQYVDESQSAWHAGNSVRATWRLIKRGVNPNLYTIGIEHEGFGNQEWTEAMYQASAALVRDISDRWKIPLDRNHIIGHREIRADKTCPGFKVNLNRLIELAKGVGATFHIVRRGDTLSAIARRYRTSIAAIQQLNPQITDPNRICEGERIRVR